MEQVFWLQVPVSPAESPEIELPEGLELVDQTQPAYDRGYTRFYLRADRRIRDASIGLRHPNGEQQKVPLEVRSYREDLEHWLASLPGFDPDARKAGRSVYSDERIEQARRNLREFPALQRELRPSTRFAPMRDAGQLFQSLPSWNVPRRVYGDFECPDCGERLFAASAYYPWQDDEVEQPFRLQCPVSGKWYPSNDWAAGDFSSGDYPDDGWGWFSGSEDPEAAAAWIAHYNHRVHWLNLGEQLQRMTKRFLLLDEQEEAHRLGVLLARLAYIYPGMDARWQQTDERYLRPGRILMDGNWERGEIILPAARAYDAIFDFLDEDEELVAFLQSKDPSIQNSDDVKRLIETGFLQVAALDLLNRNATGGNMGARESHQLQLAAAINMPGVSDALLRDVAENSYNSGLNRGNFLDQNFINLRSREGPGMVAGLTYAPDYFRRAIEIIESLESVRPIAERESDGSLFGSGLFPKIEAELETWLEFCLGGRFPPLWGNGAADPPGPIFLHGVAMGESLVETFETLYRWQPLDKLARALHAIGLSETPPLFAEDIGPQVKAHIERIGPAEPMQSRVMDGFGFVLMESRPHAADPLDRAGLSLRYGASSGHNHQDNLDLQLFAQGVSMTPQLGYPVWTHPLGSVGHAAHQNTGLIDRSPQYAYTRDSRTPPTARGTLLQFSVGPGATFAEVEAEPTGFPNRMYRRSAMLVDAPDNNVYVVDILRLSGGETRSYAMNGPPYAAFRSSESFDAEKEAVFDVGPMPLNAKMQPNIVDAQQLRTDETFQFEWDYLTEAPEDWSPGLSSQSGVEWPQVAEGTRLRVTFPGQDGRSYHTARFAKPDSPPIRFLFAEDVEADGDSTFIAIWEPYTGEPFIEQVRKLPVMSGNSHAGGKLDPVAIEVTLRDGRRDVFISTVDSSQTHVFGGDLIFKGRFGYRSEDAEGLRLQHLVDGSHFEWDGGGVSDHSPTWQGRIAEVDYGQRLVRFTDPVADVAPGSGSLLFIDNGQRRMAYEVLEKVDDTTLKLRHTALLYRGRVSAIHEDGISVDIAPPIEVASGFPPGYYDRTVAADGDGEVIGRVERIEGERIYLDAMRLQDFETVELFEYGEEDQATLYQHYFYQRKEERIP